MGDATRHGGIWARAHGAAAILLLVAVFARALIPAGFMPGRSGDGAPIVICTGVGAQVIHDGSPQGRSEKARHHDVCAFAGLAAAPPPPADIAPRPPVLAASDPVLVAASQTVGDPDRRRPQAARAPPIRI